ncbi:response regulator [Flavobacterium sp. RSP29]|uniref:ATP-binding response regulator n=1 Tax=Flavobacterium sp. RSP29 TaxID=3401731 RepID=UPI003AAE18A4
MNKNKILVVDDELNIRDTITELLICQNYDVKAARNGQEALNVLDYWTPDLIVCDIMMPVMDGNALHEIIKESPSLSAIPFIFLTAKSENNLMRQCLLAGADDFLSKPFEIKELVRIIEAKIVRFEKIKSEHTNLYTGKKTSFLHEINTPLNGILGSIELLMSNDINLEKNQIEEFYESIKISGERLNRTMQNIILYQNLKNNLLPFEDVSSTQIRKNFLNVKRKLFQIYDNQEKRISFEIDKASIKMSEKYLHFILFELIDNALKFSPSTKMICVSGERFNDEYYELIIRDSGIGFSEDELKKIGAAQQFNREKMEQQGLGLGLYLSKIIIKKSKGIFTIISNVNEGTRIKIFLPLGI